MNRHWDRHSRRPISSLPDIGRWSAGRRRPLRHWGCASRVAGPAGHARAARAGSFAKSLPGSLASSHGVSQTPGASRRSITSLRRGEEKGEGRTRRPKNKEYGQRSVGFESFTPLLSQGAVDHAHEIPGGAGIHAELRVVVRIRPGGDGVVLALAGGDQGLHSV